MRHRFDEEILQQIWSHNRECLVCGKSHADCFHHIISDSSIRYKDGTFNKSVLNACPINNFECHLYNPELHKVETERRLLIRVLIEVIKSGYSLRDIDVEFIIAYQNIYEGKY